MFEAISPIDLNAKTPPAHLGVVVHNIDYF